MNVKRLLAALLTVAALCGLLVIPAGAATPAAGFTDIADSATADAAEVLRLLGVVEGTSTGRYNPSGLLTRAQFCKMAIEIRGEGDRAAAQMNRTIFLDVKSTHWARGYINYASSIVAGSGATAERLVSGVGNGKFLPDRNITYAEAITMAMRLLGYTAADTTSGQTWYDGYVSAAKLLGLLDGINAGYNDNLTRGQAALLFRNLLFARPNGSDQPYLVTLGGSVVDNVILLSIDAAAEDGSLGAIKVTDGTGARAYKTDHAAFDASLEGARVTVVLDRDGKVLTLRATGSNTSRTVTVAEAEVTYLTAANGERFTVAPSAVIYKDGAASTYSAVYMDLKPGTRLTLYYAASGALDYGFIPQISTSDSAMVAKTAVSGNPFSSLVGSDTGYRILKNGVTAGLSDIRQYDVATYDKATKTLSISDLRITGVYQNASPSPKTPLTVTVLGATFSVLPSAMSDLASFKIGDTITLLLTNDGRVAGAVSSSAARSTAVGVVTACSTNSATVKPLMDLTDATGHSVTFTGEVNYSQYNAERMLGRLVTVSSSRIGQLTLTTLSGSGATGSLNVSKRTLGSLSLADSVYLYERVGNSAPVAIKWGQLTQDIIPASKISYVGTDYAGRVSILVLDDVTGDQYTYGLATVKSVTTDYFGDGAINNTSISVSRGADSSQPLIGGVSVQSGAAVGVIASLETLGSYHRLASWVELKAVTGVSRSAFNITGSASDSATPMGTVTTAELVLPVAGNVACYNATTRTWFSSLAEARAYSDNLTIYYDRAPEEGGKVRVVVVQ